MCRWLGEGVGPGTPGRSGAPRKSLSLGWGGRMVPIGRDTNTGEKAGTAKQCRRRHPSVKGRAEVLLGSGILLNHYIEYVPLWRAARTPKNKLSAKISVTFKPLPKSRSAFHW